MSAPTAERGVAVLITVDQLLTALRQLKSDDLEIVEAALFKLRRDRMSAETWIAIWNSMTYKGQVIGQFSDRREDWYDDDGR